MNKFIRSWILFSIVGTLALAQCQGQQGPAGSGVAGVGCGANNGSSLDVLTGASNLEGPVDLPVTIAKAVDGIDASTMSFTPSSSLSVGVPLTDQANLAASSDVVGYISFYLKNRECELVGVFIENSLVTTLTSTEDDNCQYQLDITAGLAGRAISYVVFESGSRGVAGETTSPPVITVLNEPTGLLSNYTLSVAITNLPYYSSFYINTGDMAYINIDDESHLIFPVTVSGTDTKLYKVPGTSGDAELFSDVTNPVSYLSSSNDYLYEVDSAAALFSISSDGILSDLAVGGDVLQMAVHPSGRYVAFTGELDSGYEAVFIYDAESDEVLGPVPYNAENLALSEINIAWGGATGMSLTYYQGDRYYLGEMNLTLALEGTIDTSAALSAKAASTFALANPLPMANALSTVFFQCTDSDGILNLCGYDNETDQTSSLGIDIGYSIANYHPSRDLISYLVFEAKTTPSTIGFLDISTGDVSYVNLGVHPQPSPVSRNLVSYQSAILDTVQISTIRVSSTIIDAVDDLSVAADTEDDLASGEGSVFIASGGFPPYSFAVTSGTGTINSATGYYIAGSSVGTETITVTDAEGSTSTATIDVSSPCPENDEFTNSYSDCWAKYNLDFSATLELSLTQSDSFFDNLVVLSSLGSGVLNLATTNVSGFVRTVDGGSGTTFFAQEVSNSANFAVSFDAQDIQKENGEDVVFGITSDGSTDFAYLIGWASAQYTRTCISNAGLCGADNDVRAGGNDQYICLSRSDDTFKTYVSDDGQTWNEIFSDDLEGITSTFYFGIDFSDNNAGSGGISMNLNSVHVTTSSSTCPTF